jgi:cytochrome P450
MFVSRAASLDPANFHAPREFRPERWIEGPAGGKAHEAATHVPFGSGPRICPGRTLALLEMRLVLAALYKTFDFVRVGASSDVTERHAWTMGPDGLRMRPRWRAATGS